MKPKIKDDHNVLQMMALSWQLPGILQVVAGAAAILTHEIIGDSSENEDSHKEIVTY